MSFLVELHSLGGSMGEAVEPIEVVHVATREEADAIIEKVDSHEASDFGELLWAILVEVPEVVSGEDGITQMFNNYYFEDYEDDNDE